MLKVGHRPPAPSRIEASAKVRLLWVHTQRLLNETEIGGLAGSKRSRASTPKNGPVKSCWQVFALYWPKRSNSTAKKREQLLRAVLKKRPCRYEAARAAALPS